MASACGKLVSTIFIIIIMIMMRKIVLLVPSNYHKIIIKILIIKITSIW